MCPCCQATAALCAWGHPSRCLLVSCALPRPVHSRGGVQPAPPGRCPWSPQHPSRRLTLLPRAPGFLLPVVLQTPHTSGPCCLLPVCQMTAWGLEEQPVTCAADSGLWAGGAHVLSDGHQAHWVGQRFLWLAQAGARGRQMVPSLLVCCPSPGLGWDGVLSLCPPGLSTGGLVAGTYLCPGWEGQSGGQGLPLWVLQDLPAPCLLGGSSECLLPRG